jgi:hypothetical protein
VWSCLDARLAARNGGKRHAAPPSRTGRACIIGLGCWTWGVSFAGQAPDEIELQDAHLCVAALDERPECSVFGVFDGHGGHVISHLWYVC